MEEITIHEARNVLKRLVNERKSLEKALAAAELLSDIEINISNKQQVLAGITDMLAAKEQKLVELDENISEIHQRREQACVAREKQSEAKVAYAKGVLEDLQSQFANLKRDFDERSSELQIEYDNQAAGYKMTIDKLKSDISKLRDELAGLQTTAKRLAGV